ncbi:helix-turn-helix domain-containing protein [Paenibacillus sp. GCM10023248]|uniref:helix-turn-helix domain-containing protein n=1 Tax=Bacillales TaxID=1385 RepID=UPI0023797494|nr:MULTISPECIES: helix-turn-helix domain-containing protein [Bacillales]MDD9269462.1 helix-turn-helix domain-containing protein [Paenibacillus sp. MAHUQ-63]MDR6880922.1 YesN/AraC family two-component response regulator [Bacillus sp. 3255]
MSKDQGLFGKWMKRKSVFVTLLLSFIFVFMIPVMIGSVVYLKIEDIMVRNAYRANSVMLEQLKYVVNSKTQEVDFLMRQIAFHPKQQLLMQQGEESSSSDVYAFIEFMKELTRYKAYNTFIEDMYVYFGNTDTVLTASMKTDAFTLFDNIYKYNDMTFDDYRSKILLGNHNKTYMHTVLSTSNLKSENMITFVQSLPFGEYNRRAGSLVILINEDEIRNLLKEVEGLHQGAVYVLNKEKELLIGPSDGKVPYDQFKEMITGEKGELLTTVNKEEMYISYTTSSENDWIYLSAFPKSLVLKQVDQVKAWSLVAVAICLLLGIFLCVYLTRRHYSPIRELVTMISRGRTEPSVEPDNELKLIRETVESLFGKENELEDKLAHQLPMIRSHFLSRLIRGQVDTSTITVHDLDLLNLQFQYEWFATMIIDIEDSARFMKEDTEREWILLRFIVINLSNELLDGNGYEFEEEKNRIVVLFNFNHESAETRQRIDEFGSRLLNVMRERFKVRISLGISGRHEGIGSVTKCYDEAMLALSYKIIRGSQDILYYDEVKTKDSIFYRFPKDLEVQLTNYTKHGDHQNTERLLNSLYELNVNHNQLSPEMGRWFFLDLQSILFKLMEALRIDYSQISHWHMDPNQVWAESGTMDQAFEKIKSTYLEVCGLVKEDRSDHGELLYRKIIAFIEEEYGNNNLGLAMIADYLHLSPIYISSFYKKHCGENITDTITQMRVEHAKRLLAEGLTVQEVALQVGYASNIVLTKVFKKVEGITPGKYREQLENAKMS